MKKKLYLLAAFIALNASAQFTSRTESSFHFAYSEIEGLQSYDKTDPHKVVRTKSAKLIIQLKVNTKKEILQVRATHTIDELALFDLYDKQLIYTQKQNAISLANLTRGVYVLKTKIKGTIISKKIILQ